VRGQVCKAAKWLGIELDDEANRRDATRISAPGSRVSVWVIPTNEELMIAQYARELLRTDG
jgi:acetate kinase